MGSPKEPRQLPQRVGNAVAAARGNKRGTAVLAIAVAVLLLVGAGLAYWWKSSHPYVPPPDFAAGTAGPDVVVGVKSGETADDISQEMLKKGVTKSASAFFDAAVSNDAMGSLQPGYYLVPSHIPGAEAVEKLVDPKSRVGNMVLSEGRQLLDNSDLDTGSTREGIFRKIAKASCYKPNGKERCVSYEDIKEAAASDDLAALGVPEWLRDDVAKAPRKETQLEGLIISGSVDFDPSASPTQILNQLVSESAQRYEDSGILKNGPKGYTPYQKLVMASLVERESHPKDFGKVARVILNRLAKPMQLQFDSTVNYGLDTVELATTDADRARVTPWNTYAMDGLPATPIASPSLDALKAVEDPEKGPWLYFVTVDAKGTTVFTDNLEEHEKNVQKAKDSGILDQGR
ncbi:MAG: endolytic transglycosylase MltG [Nocardiaceae bacterium]|nr:endolytic transglycosylase MltG [Nocardiaceae bacterium]